jgi:kynurenine 3-monooxygenase
MELEVLHLWARKQSWMIANPNTDHSFGCTLFMPHEGEEASFAALRTGEDLTRFFQRHFADAYARMPTLVDDFFSRPMGRHQTAEGGPWYFEDKVLVLGDAAHAMSPQFAQGMNCAFEDGTIFMRCLERCHDRWDEVFPAFFEARRIDVDAVVRMTAQNQREIRESIADDRFNLRKAIEHRLMRKYPTSYASMHICVMFTTVRYAFAEACGVVQGKLLDAICEGVTSVDQIDWSRVESLLVGYRDEVHRLARDLGVDLATAGLLSAPG